MFPGVLKHLFLLRFEIPIEASFYLEAHTGYLCEEVSRLPPFCPGLPPLLGCPSFSEELGSGPALLLGLLSYRSHPWAHSVAAAGVCFKQRGELHFYESIESWFPHWGVISQPRTGTLLFIYHKACLPSLPELSKLEREPSIEHYTVSLGSSSPNPNPLTRSNTAWKDCIISISHSFF